MELDLQGDCGVERFSFLVIYERFDGGVGEKSIVLNEVVSLGWGELGLRLGLQKCFWVSLPKV